MSRVMSRVLPRRAALRALMAPAALSAICLLPRAARAEEPVLGTPGKDSGWIPTPAGMVEAMLTLAEVGPEDTVVDLGSGDGRIPILAAKLFGARGLGIEFNPELVAYSQRVAQREGLADRVRFVQGDIFATDFSHASVVTLFMPPDFNLRIRPTLLAMKPGTRVVAFNFDMGDWPVDQSVWVDAQRGMLWRVPASVAGNWALTFDHAGEPAQVLHLTQRYQKVQGHLMLGAERLNLWDLRFEVDRLQFTTLHRGRRRDYDARVAGDVLAGHVEALGQPTRQWKASRAG